MGKVIAQVSVAMLMAACSTGYPVVPELPAVALPATGHYSSVVSAEDDGYFVVTLGRFPLILTAGDDGSR
jgi:hypothetical protein